MPTRLLLLRHGQSTWNAEGRWQGWSDPPLSDLGRAQAAEAAAHLADAGLTGVVASDLERARATAGIIAAALGLGPVVVEADLREYNVGDWEGLTRSQIEAGWPEQLGDWREGRLLATPGGETRAAFLVRVSAALARVVTSPGLGDTVLVVIHGGAIRAAEQVTGGERSSVIDNLAGRWFIADGDGHLRPDDVTFLLGAQRRTSPPSL
ncbi:MAG: histidine phosphatase family protein [Acidimicrobiales bacterium]